MLVKFAITPDNSSYSVQDGSSVVSTELQGGAARYRTDIANPTSKVDVAWIVGAEGYKYIRSFFNAITAKGATPFLIDLLLDEPFLTEHKAYFRPNSLRLTATKGSVFWVSASLEVYPVESTDEADYVYIYNAMGKSWQIQEDKLNVIVNTDWPEVL